MIKSLHFVDENIRRQKEFFQRKTRGDLLVYANCPLAEYISNNGFPFKRDKLFLDFFEDPHNYLLSEELLNLHAFDLGVLAVEYARALADMHYERIGDDYCPDIRIRGGFCGKCSDNKFCIFPLCFFSPSPGILKGLYLGSRSFYFSRLRLENDIIILTTLKRWVQIYQVNSFIFDMVL